jgi:hypothetical protein
MNMPSHEVDNLPEPPWTKLYVSSNKNISVTSGTFVAFSVGGRSDDFFGLIVEINAEAATVRIHLFLTWA